MPPRAGTPRPRPAVKLRGRLCGRWQTRAGREEIRGLWGHALGGGAFLVGGGILGNYTVRPLKGRGGPEAPGAPGAIRDSSEDRRASAGPEARLEPPRTWEPSVGVVPHQVPCQAGPGAGGRLLWGQGAPHPPCATAQAHWHPAGPSNWEDATTDRVDQAAPQTAGGSGGPCARDGLWGTHPSVRMCT